MRPVVAHHEVVPRRHLDGPKACAAARRLAGCTALQALPVDVHVAVALRSLSSTVSPAARSTASRTSPCAAPHSPRGVLKTMISPGGGPQVVDEPVREHPVGEARLTADRGLGAVQRALHRRRRDPVGVDDVRLDEQHDRYRPDDRDDPVDRDPRLSGRRLVSRSTGLCECLTGEAVGAACRVPRRPAASRSCRESARGGAGSTSRDPRLGNRLCPAPGAEAQRRPGASAAPARLRRRARSRRRLLDILRSVLDVAHAALRERLCSARQPSIRAWFPERSTSGTSQPENSAGRV